jgi:hypothetical protein
MHESRGLSVLKLACIYTDLIKIGVCDIAVTAAYSVLLLVQNIACNYTMHYI